MSVFPWHCCKEMSFWHNAARPSIRPLKAIKYFSILRQKKDSTKIHEDVLIAVMHSFGPFV